MSSPSRNENHPSPIQTKLIALSVGLGLFFSFFKQVADGGLLLFTAFLVSCGLTSGLVYSFLESSYKRKREGGSEEGSTEDSGSSEAVPVSSKERVTKTFKFGCLSIILIAILVPVIVFLGIAAIIQLGRLLS